MSFDKDFESKKQAFEQFLYAKAETLAAPEPLKKAMLYALTSGGKRIRPVLLIEACRLFREPDDGVYTLAAAIECIHTYSLIHDDLPAMDDDDMRRGKPTVHKAFGEGMAILAGDGLLNYAYELLFEAAAGGEAYVRAGKTIADACGAAGLIGGQALDISGGQPDGKRIRYIYQHKTADLITAAVRAGGIVGGANEEQLKLLREYGDNFGFAFQLGDDLLDADEDENSFVGIYGEAVAKTTLNESVAMANAHIGFLGKNAVFFKKLAQRSINRKM